MLTLYYARPSLYSRPVWLALLEKQVPFELIPVKMDGSQSSSEKGSGGCSELAQYDSEFTAVNPFSRIPVLIDDGLRVIESSAILDYLEAKYPQPALLPADAKAIATVRMVQSVAMNELLLTVFGLIVHAHKPQKLEYLKQRANNVLIFFETALEETYFGGENLSLADIAAGTLVPMLPQLDVSLANYPKISEWSQRLLLRDAWQQIQLSTEEWHYYKQHLGSIVKTWEKRRRQTLQSRV